MKFLTDENIAVSIVESLRIAGYDIKDIKEEKLGGVPDSRVLELANEENRIIITHDKDFTGFAKKHKGIILLRFQNQRPLIVSNTLLQLLRSSLRRKISNQLTVLSETNVVIHRR